MRDASMTKSGRKAVLFVKYAGRMVYVHSGLNASDILDEAMIRETLSSMLKLSSASHCTRFTYVAYHDQDTHCTARKVNNKL